MLLHTDAFTHRRFYTKKLLHTEAFTHFAGQLGNHNFTSVFGDRTSFRAKGLRREPGNRNVTTQFWAIEPRFVRKGGAGRLEFAMLQLSFGRSNLVSCERVAPDTLKSQFYFSF